MVFQKSEILKNAVSERWCADSRDVNRISTDLKYLCGAYTLLSTSQTELHIIKQVYTTCLPCGYGDEDFEHFILNCSYLEYTRNQIISEIKRGGGVYSLLGKTCFQEMCDQKR